MLGGSVGLIGVDMSSRNVLSEPLVTVPWGNENPAGQISRPRSNLRRSTESGECLRTQYHAKEIAPKSAMKKSRSDHKPLRVDIGKKGIDMQFDPGDSMTWQDR